MPGKGMTNKEAIEYAAKNSFLELYNKGRADGKAEAIDEFVNDMIRKINVEKKLLAEGKKNNMFFLRDCLKVFVESMSEHFKEKSNEPTDNF